MLSTTLPAAGASFKPTKPGSNTNTHDRTFRLLGREEEAVPPRFKARRPARKY
jgi:hypothetical protein